MTVRGGGGARGLASVIVILLTSDGAKREARGRPVRATGELDFPARCDRRQLTRSTRLALARRRTAHAPSYRPFALARTTLVAAALASPRGLPSRRVSPRARRRRDRRDAPRRAAVRRRRRRPRHDGGVREGGERGGWRPRDERRRDSRARGVRVRGVAVVGNKREERRRGDGGEDVDVEFSRRGARRRDG